MPKLFKNYEEYLSTIITMIRDFSDEAHNKIKLAINVCHSLQDDNDKIFRLNTTFMECLWEMPEAIDVGFPQYTIQQYNLTRTILEYHDFNCKDITNCRVCKDRRITIDKLRNNNERKRPRIHSK
tara:strand:- start:5025 stop:5399 length:375 start_codon:yes stop_codon:yes gene_type:complete